MFAYDLLFFCFLNRFKFYGDATPQVQAWDASRLRPAPPYNPFLAESLRQQSANRCNNNSMNANVTSGLKCPPKGDVDTEDYYSEVTNEDYFPVLDLLDSFSSMRQSYSGKKVATLKS